MSTALSLPTASAGALTLLAEAPPENVAELVHRLGDIPLERIRMQPPPGTATVADLLAWNYAKQGPLCELVEGVLVEKGMSYLAAILEVAISTALAIYNKSHRLGVITSASGEHQLRPKLVRLPDVGYAFWHRFPEGRVTDDPAPLIAPDLAVEVLSPSNTRREMDRKRREYFEAGTQLVWIVDPEKRTVEVYTSLDKVTVLSETDTLDGGPLLPGFSLPLKSLFAELDASAPPPAA
jgi:Uma2 family endonuclease